VVVPVLREGAPSGNDRQAQGGGGMLRNFVDCVPVPMQTPGAPYVDTSSDGRSRSSGSSDLGNVLLKPWCLG
jgi:hypothetical protein